VGFFRGDLVAVGEEDVRRLTAAIVDRAGFAWAVMPPNPDLEAEMLAQWTENQEHMRSVQELDVRSCLVVPLITRGETIGALGMAWTRPGRAYGPEDLVLAEELARRAATAVDHANQVGEAVLRLLLGNAESG